MRSNRNRLWLSLAVAALMLVYWGQVVHAIHGESLTWDEGDHIFAGYQSWKTHDFGLNPEHPPLVKQIATLPLLPLHITAPPLQGRPFKVESYMDGRELLFRNGRYPANTLVFRVRLFASIFGLAAALLVFLAASEMFSTTAGLIALALFAFEPTLLAHGAYVTTDMAATCTIFATVYAFWRWAKRPTLPRLAVTGLAAGIALASKHSTVLLAPMLLLLAATVFLHHRDRQPFKPSAELVRFTAALLGITVIACVALWAFYGFRYAARPAGLTLSPSLAEYVHPLAPHEARGILLLARLRLLPESYLYGLADVRAMANGMPSYFLGQVYAHGVWIYFPTLFLIKSTLGMLALLALTACAIARRWLQPSLELAFLLVPPALYMFVAMTSHLNIGARHILPVFLFCTVLAGAGAATLLRRSRGWTAAVVMLILLHVGSSLHASPNFIAYANEAWGGPSHTYRYLSDSNTDWAQQLIATSDALREHHVQHCWIAYFASPFILPSDYGIPCQLLPTFDSLSVDDRLAVPPVIDGPVLISAGDLNGFEFGSSALNPYESFRSAKPAAYIQDGVFWFDGRFSVPLASALLHVQQSTAALAAHDNALAVSEARLAEQIAPGAIQTELALGDALAAAGQENSATASTSTAAANSASASTASARAAYDRAAQTIATMQPDARAIWQSTLAAKLAAIK